MLSITLYAFTNEKDVLFEKDVIIQPLLETCFATRNYDYDYKLRFQYQMSILH